MNKMQKLLVALIFFYGKILSAQTPLEKAQTFFDQKKYTEAIAVLQPVLEGVGSLQPGEKTTLYNLLGQSYAKTQLFDKAADNLEKGLVAAAGNDTLCAHFHYQLGLARYRLSAYQEATDQVIKARDLYKNLYGTNHKNYTACLNSLGFFYHIQAKYSDAEKVFQEARQINLKLTGGEDLQYARIINNLADVYVQLNRYDQAQELYRTSLRIKEKISGKNSRDYANTLYNMADFSAELGRYAQAEDYLLQGLEILKGLGNTNQDYLKFLDYLAIVSEKTGKKTAAEGLFREALALRETAGATQSADYCLNLINLGHLLLSLEKLDSAQLMLEKAKPLAVAVFGINHPTYAGLLTTSAEIYAEKGDKDRARQLYEESSKIVQKALGKDHIAYFNAQFAYALFLHKQGQKKEAAAIYKKIERIPKDYLKRTSRFLSEKELDEKVQSYRDYARAIYSAARDLPDDPEMAKLAYNTALYYRAFVLGNMQQMRVGMQNAQKIVEARDIATSLHRQLENELNLPVENRKNTAELEAKIAEKEAEIANILGSARTETDVPTWEMVQNMLADREAAVEYIAFSNPTRRDSIDYAALVLTPESIQPVFVPLCSETDLSMLQPIGLSRKMDFVAQVYQFSSRGLEPTTGPKKSLLQLVWNPLMAYLPQVRKIYLTTDGLLARVSFGALPLTLESTVADSVDIVLKTTSAHIKPVDNQIAAYSSHKALVLGGVQYEQTGGSALATRSDRANNWNYLPWTEKECTEITKLLVQAKYAVTGLQGSAASEKNVSDTLSHSPDWRFLHFATHGYFREQTEKDSADLYYGTNMRNSGLVLANANQSAALPGGSNGLWNAYEISQLDLSATELVVLSACETGLGDWKESEGVFGLQRAFLAAGAGNIIMSLWQVPDRETKDFMAIFYQNLLLKNLPIREAFYQTQKNFRERQFNPYQWAGFVLLER